MANTDATRKQDLLEAAQAATSPDYLAARARVSRGKPPVASRSVVYTSLGVLVAVVVYLLAAQPEWVFTPEETPESPEVVAASMRMLLVRERQRVEAFRFRNGRLPASLTEAGGNNPEAEMIRGPGGSYTIRALVGGAALELRSTDSVEAFLGNSLQVILSRGSTR